MVKHLYFDQLNTLASIGGYSENIRLSQLTSVFLLSACVVLREQWLWQTPLTKIDETEYQNIIAMIEKAEYELMSGNIGQIIATVADLSGDDSYIYLDGTNVDVVDYPELANNVPSNWVSGGTIFLPDLTDSGLFGGVEDFGDIIGENEHQLDISELATHTHTQQSHNHSYTLATPVTVAGGEIPATATLTTVAPSVTGGTVAVNNETGGNQPHNNIQSSMKVRWYIVGK